jgi:heme-degrading monooxygenase HmoA
LPGRRTISVSVWRSPEDLRNFVRSATHAEIMRRHRLTGDLITIAWTAERFDRWLIWQQALERLSNPELTRH